MERLNREARSWRLRTTLMNVECGRLNNKIGLMNVDCGKLDNKIGLRVCH